MAEFLLELFSEEIPARLQAPAAEDLRKLLTAALAPLVIGKSFAFSTPRRIGCVIEDLPDRTADKMIETRGPRVGAPEAAIAGFLRSAGLSSIDQCEVRQSDKGGFYMAARTEPGRPIADELADRVPDCMDRLVWPKSMRWAGHDVRWVRPLHSILAVLATETASDIVPVRWRLDRSKDGGAALLAGDVTFGHRMLAPEPISVVRFQDYRAKLERAFVLLDIHDGRANRRQKISDGIAACAAAQGLTVKADDALLDEVTGLVEWPVVRLGRIEPRFMALPAELLTTSMRTHQKYFACEDETGALAPYFVVVGNNETLDGGKRMVAGNERVLRARLSDAAFFWRLDRSITLESRLPKLAERVFHAKLGSVLDKIDRMAALAETLVPLVPGAGIEAAKRAIRLAKADLSSALVGEFPELQGVAGRYLALHEGEPAEIADAIEQHYAPTGLAGRVPTAPLGIVASLADKVDTLAGFFSIGETPTGSKDPYALRRATLGIIRIVLDNRLRLPLRQVFDKALALYPTVAPAGCVDDLMAFVADRVKIVLREAGIRHDLVTAVFALGGEDDVFRLVARTRALQAFLDEEDGKNLLVAYRRAARIVSIEEKKDGTAYRERPDVAALELAEEIDLTQALATVDAQSEELLRDENDAGAMALLARLRGPVDAFFNRVTVNVEQPSLRANRLRVLGQIRQAMDRIADFSRIEG